MKGGINYRGINSCGINCRVVNCCGINFRGINCRGISVRTPKQNIKIVNKDSVIVFPLQICDADSKHIIYVIDCQGEFHEQIHFMETFTHYLISHAEHNTINITFIAGNLSIWNFHEREILSDSDCNGTLPISEVLEFTDQWERSVDSECELYLSIIFIHNLTGEKAKIINETIESDLKNNISITRFFIAKYSGTFFPINYVYFIPSFENLNVGEVFPRVCDLNHRDYSFTYTDGKYMNSTYYIAKQLQALAGVDVFCYCKSRHGSQVISLETYQEVIIVFEHLMKVFANKTFNEINIHLNLVFDHWKTAGSKRLQWQLATPYSFFLPPQYNDWLGCFSLKLTTAKNFRLLAEEFYNFGNYLAGIDCDERLPNTLLVCESYERLLLSNISGIGVNSMWVLDRDSLMEFINKIFIYNFERPDLFTGGQCIVETNTARNVLESNLCGGEVVNEATNQTHSDRNVLTYILSKQHDSYYTFKTVDISKCDNYDECQSKVTNETTGLTSNTDASIYCLDPKEVHQVCSAHDVDLNLDLEYFQCRTNEDQHFYTCIKDPKGQCSDNSNLLYCENFTCPEALLKCLNSYCVFPFQFNDGTFDCPVGDDEQFVYVVDGHSYNARLSFVIRDMCMDSVSFDNLFSFLNESRFICKHICPQNYKCISSKSKIQNGNSTDIIVSHFTTDFNILKMFDMFYLNLDLVNWNKFIPFIYFVAFEGVNCKINSFDQEFQNWKFDELIILDLSKNVIQHSNDIKSIENFSKLKYLNLSQNGNLVIDQNFLFPKLLEIIDLSYTKISELQHDAFLSLASLRHLNLSFTLISKFQDTGIPTNFKLETLYVQGFQTKYLAKDFFRGLKILSELRASDFAMCCPQILNPNIDVDKCFAPIDIISSCKHLVGDTFKRIVIWIVGILTLLGNGSVLIYRIGWNREVFKQAYGYFISGLAVSDSFMGAYLIIIASIDVHFTDVYVLKDFAWRNGYLCQVLGTLSTLSSEASTFFICLVTLDRYLAITYPFGEYKFSKTTKLLLFTSVWLVSLGLALFPVVVSDWEIYSSNGLCLALPFSSTQYRGWIFCFAVFVGLNFVLCLLIIIGQLMIFINLIKANKSNASVHQNNPKRSQEGTVARKLAFVAVTDFCCWFPVGIIGILSLSGHIFNREVYAWIAVFVLPINSAINPIIYTLPTLFSLCKKYILGRV